ncbi:Galactose oxidase OS=Gibberella zeae (strain PH-1 / ATCC MYA-4620 / FGSC 9075 / NRRL 31084) GN=GAOA PE=3 SV=1 [Rhizoctonia solani AG-1 IB]|uniref:Galactose oxidase n=2 Tax=Thanatephorus cucumeris (strain AG1-IB / isolate 7/3/14) TaxID=1108050 RepID=A0A0B7FRK9_THACB|nr:Galactose oxidase OS=Gibberella zeae (strain PH-1 / ATCC MYA-4620 / FGSC 9075 / NRRL 31084) GN=GAOA PE=3 SV=1 [Rhizoctonia solani AG-1 IB]
MRNYAPLAVLAASSVAALPSVTGPAQVIPKPGQPAKAGKSNTFEVVGDSGVSAQQLFLGMPNQVFVVDKTERNPMQIAGHPAWATLYNTDTEKARGMDIITNSFCAGGNVLGNGTWLNVGGNQAVGPGGATAANGAAPYRGVDGGLSMRFLTPTADGSAEWIDDPAQYMTTRRWYPTLETLSDGTMIIIGGNQWGGFVNGAGQNNPTYEFFPSQGGPVDFELLRKTLPANLYPLTWLLPSDSLFIQTNWGTAVLDYRKNIQSNLDDIPHAVRTYPASAGTAMLPLTPANNWTATMLFCGGSDLQPRQWTDGSSKVNVPASSSCVNITPDVDAIWKDDDDLPAGRVMANMILLPDGKVFLVNGANTGTAGYGNDTWAIGQSYADEPIFTPLIYNPLAPSGKRWSEANMPKSTVARMYHSSATLLPDGSVFISGSNPNADYITNTKYPTEYAVERFYPWYYDMRRPEPVGLMDRLNYGGPGYDVTLSLEDLGGNLTKIQDTKAVVVRTGFSTHSINFGMRYVELETSYTVTPLDGGSYNITLHVAQLPPNPAILAPGPAFLFIVVDGVPSVGQMIMVGSGKIGKDSQTVSAKSQLPASSLPIGENTPGGGSGSSGGNNNQGNAAPGRTIGWTGLIMGPLIAGLVGLF